MDSAYDLDSLRTAGETRLFPERIRINVGTATFGLAAGAGEVYHALEQRVEQRRLDAILSRTGCIGYCQQEPLVDVRLPGAGRVVYIQMTRPRVRALVDALKRGELPLDNAWCVIDEEELLVENHIQRFARPEQLSSLPALSQVPFFASQRKIVLRNCGTIDPNQIEEYTARGGYRSLHKALFAFTPQQVIDEVRNAGLRGRGGAGFPTSTRDKHKIINMWFRLAEQAGA